MVLRLSIFYNQDKTFFSGYTRHPLTLIMTRKATGIKSQVTSKHQIDFLDKKM